MGNVESTGDASRDLYAAAKKGDIAAVNRLHAVGAGLEWRDAKHRTALMVAAQRRHEFSDRVALRLLQLGAEVHVWGATPDVGTPLHLAVAAQASETTLLLLQAGASPFLVHPGGDATALDAAASVNDVKLVRRLETLGLFAAWMLLRREPSGILGALTGKQTMHLRWVAVVPRYKATKSGLVCRHQIRLSRSRGEAQPLEVWDVEGAALAAGTACVTVRFSSGAQRLLNFVGADAAAAAGGAAAPAGPGAASAAAALVAACNNRAPPRVPVVGPRRSLVAQGPPEAAAAGAGAFPSPPQAAGPPPLPPLPAAAPPPPRRSAEEEEEEADIAEAIRRSLLLQDSAGFSGIQVGGGAEAADDAAGEAAEAEPEAPSAPAAEAPSAPPLASEEAEWAARKAAAARKRMEEEDQTLCVICLTNGRTAGLLHGTSMHAVACAECAPLLQQKPCPICRQTVERVIAIFG